MYQQTRLRQVIILINKKRIQPVEIPARDKHKVERPMFKLPMSIITIGLSTFVLAAPAIADGTASEATVTITKTDFKGRPPFKRRSETLPVQDVASLETTQATSTGEYVTITTVDFKGKPPFKRRTETVLVENIASYEIESSDNGDTRKSRFSGKPPYRR